MTELTCYMHATVAMLDGEWIVFFVDEDYN